MTEVLIVDNVNNASGAPSIARLIADTLGCGVICIRQTDSPRYAPLAYGLRGNSAWLYPFAALSLLLNVRTWLLICRADAVIINSSLSIPIAIVARLLGRRIILMLHEAHFKNLLYRITIGWALRWADVIVTPSETAYRALHIPRDKWEVIFNRMDDRFYRPLEAARRLGRSSILFCGRRSRAKGYERFLAMKDEIRSGAFPIDLTGTHEPSFIETFSDAPLTPETYRAFDAVVVLTDNELWKETFGIVGCEAAAAGCLPFFADHYAYAEIWAGFPDLDLGTRTPHEMVAHISAILHDTPRREALSEAVHAHAMTVTSRQAFELKWRDLLAREAA